MGIDRKKVRSAAQKQVRKGNWKRAITEYEKLVDEDGSDVRSRLKLADLYTRVGNEDEAIASYKAVGRHHAGQDFYQKAVAVYKQAIRLQPEDGDLHRRVGEAYHRLDRLKDAAEAYRDAQRRYKQAGRREMQQKVLEELVRIDPEDVGLHIQLAECYAKADEQGRALETFRTAAEMLDEEGRLDDYVQVAERILYFDPDDVQVRKEAIDIYLDRNDNKRALKHLHVCFNNDSQDEDVLRKLAETFLRLDRQQKAILVFQQLAKLYRSQGRDDSACRVFERILGIDPDHQKAHKAVRVLGGNAPGDQPSPGEAGERGGQDQPAAGQATSADQAEAPSDDALDGIEFIDEEPEPSQPADPPPSPPASGDASPAEPSTGGTGTQLDDIARIDLGDFDDEAVDSADAPSSQTDQNRPTEPPTAEPEPVDISDSIEPIEPQAADGGEQTGEDLEEMIDEAGVFIKYGLYDNAREVIQKILERDRANLRAFEKRRELYAALDEPRAEASTLAEMARLCSDRPERARGYLQEAAALDGAGDEVRRAADEIGVSLDVSADGADQPAERPEQFEEIEPEPIDDPEDVEEIDDVQEIEEFEQLDEIEEIEPEPVEPPASEDDEEVVELDPDEVEMVEEKDGGGEFPAMGNDVIDSSNFVVEESGDDLDDELEAVSELSEDTQPDATPPPADDDPMAQTDFQEPADGLGFTEEEVEGALNGLFDSFAEDQEQGQSSGSASLSNEFEPVENDDLAEPTTGAADNDGIDIDSDVLNTNFELGEAYRDMGLYDEAIDEFREAIDDPDAAPEARYHIALCKADKGETDEAADTLSQLAKNTNLSEDLRSAARNKLDELDAPRP